MKWSAGKHTINNFCKNVRKYLKMQNVAQVNIFLKMKCSEKDCFMEKRLYLKVSGLIIDFPAPFFVEMGNHNKA